jgi:hypothetical protein
MPVLRPLPMPSPFKAMLMQKTGRRSRTTLHKLLIGSYEFIFFVPFPSFVAKFLSSTAKVTKDKKIGVLSFTEMCLEGGKAAISIGSTSPPPGRPSRAS